MAQHRISGDDTLDLLEAYLAAVYRIEMAGTWWPLQVGHPAPHALDAALATHPAHPAHPPQPAPSSLEATLAAKPGTGSTWTLLTAWNPQSLPRDDDANRAADAALQAQLDALRKPRWPAVGGSPDGSWEEPGWLVAGLDAATADALARGHGQAGILHWQAGTPVRLRMYRPHPPGATPACVDWLSPSIPG